MLPTTLTEPAHAAAERLVARGESIAVAESAAGGLISAALVAVPGCSAFYRGGLVVYTLDGARAQFAGAPRPADLRGATEPFAAWLATTVAASLGTTWGIGETGASGPTGNPYGDPPGHSWAAVSGPDGVTARNLRTGSDDRAANMEAFAAAALTLLVEVLTRD